MIFSKMQPSGHLGVAPMKQFLLYMLRLARHLVEFKKHVTAVDSAPISLAEPRPEGRILINARDARTIPVNARV